jgi:hypothetical protein
MIESRRMRWTGYVGHTGNRTAYKVLAGNLEGERTLGRHRHRWEVNIKMDLKEIVWKVADWFIWPRRRTSDSLYCA